MEVEDVINTNKLETVIEVSLNLRRKMKRKMRMKKRVTVMTMVREAKVEERITKLAQEVKLKVIVTPGTNLRLQQTLEKRHQNLH